MRLFTTNANEGRPFACASTLLDNDTALERCVFRVVGEGVHHGYRRRVDLFVVASALCQGAGRDETGVIVAELMDPALVAIRTSNVTTMQQDATRDQNARTALIALKDRVIGLANGTAVTLTAGEVKALLWSLYRLQ